MHRKKPFYTEVFTVRPDNFNPRTAIAALYVLHNEELLLLLRADTRPEGTFWGVPGGTIEHDELPECAAYRELIEETGIALLPGSLISVGELYIRKPRVDFIYHAYSITLAARPSIVLSSEHTDYTWVSHDQMRTVCLLGGAYEAYEWWRGQVGRK